MPKAKRIPIALTIAGSDSGGGAGIEADLKTFAALGVHGTAAITSVTAQNTYSVTAIHDIPPEIVVKQIEAIAEDMGVDAAKTGMLSNEEIIRAVASTVKRLGFPLVVDPVMIAKSGAPLLRPEAMNALIEEIIPVATIVTPNKHEAEKITGMKIRGVEDAKKAAKAIVEELGARAAIVKGGHLEGDYSTDILYHPETGYREYIAPRIKNGCTHGTGCAFSAAITAELAKGRSLPEAVGVAKEFITIAIDYGLKVGKGHCPVNPTAWLEIPAEKYWAIQDVEKALQLLLKNQDKIAPHAPEVGINIARSIKWIYARTPREVAAIEGRIVRIDSALKPVGSVKLGASSHMARAVLKAQEYNPKIKAALNVKYSEELIKAAQALGMKVVKVDRREEPVELKAREGSSIPWIISRAVEKNKGEVPDIVYDLGDWGKEPMIRFFGASAVEAVKKLVKTISALHS